MVYAQDRVGNGIGGQSLKLIGKLQREREVNKAIADLDPLDVDTAIQRLPLLNSEKNKEEIRDYLEQAVRGVQNQDRGNFIYASAAIRDICMFAGSLISYGVEPSDCVPGFSETLLDLSVRAETSLPRDSFIDYTSRNPEGTRERRFSSRVEEGIFINSLRQGMNSLDHCLADIMQAYNYSFEEDAFAEHCYAAANNFQIMIDAIVQVKRGISPEIFTHYIRPFFEPFKVEDKAYSAPSGAEMSILNIDLIIWGVDCKDELYIPYVEANIKRLPIIYQEICHLFEGQKSLLTKVTEYLTLGLPLREHERNSIQSLHHLLTKIYSFRMPHYKVASDNVKLRLKETSGEEIKGSSGFGIDEVKYVLDQTIKGRLLLSQLLAI